MHVFKKLTNTDYKHDKDDGEVRTVKPLAALTNDCHDSRKSETCVPKADMLFRQPDLNLYQLVRNRFSFRSIMAILILIAVL